MAGNRKIRSLLSMLLLCSMLFLDLCTPFAQAYAADIAGDPVTEAAESAASDEETSEEQTEGLSETENAEQTEQPGSTFARRAVTSACTAYDGTAVTITVEGMLPEDVTLTVDRLDRADAASEAGATLASDYSLVAGFTLELTQGDAAYVPEPGTVSVTLDGIGQTLADQAAADAEAEETEPVVLSGRKGELEPLEKVDVEDETIEFLMEQPGEVIVVVPITAKANDEPTEPAEETEQPDAPSAVDENEQPAVPTEQTEAGQSTEPVSEDEPAVPTAEGEDTQPEEPTDAEQPEEETAEASEDGDSEAVTDDPGAQEPEASIQRVPIRKAAQIYSDGTTVKYVSHTANISDDGVQSGSYANSLNFVDVVSIPGAVKLSVTIRYKTESGCDWVCMWEGEHSDYSASNNYDISKTGRLEGRTALNTWTGEVEGDTVTFGFRSDGSITDYGYYAIIEATRSPDFKLYPDWALEDLGNGSYAVVFNEAGAIYSFINEPEVLEKLGDKKDLVTEIRLNDGIAEIRSEAFSGWTSLKNVAIPNSVVRLDSNCFKGCTALETLIFEEGSPLTALPSGLFSGLTSLKEVRLPDALAELPSRTFQSLTNLTSVTIPGNTAIGSYAFSGCTKLTDVTLA